MSLDQIEGYLKAVGAAGIFAAFMFGVTWFKRILDQKRKNEVNEIDLSFKKIDLKNHTDPLADIVSASNKSHGADELVKPGGSDDQGGGEGKL